MPITQSEQRELDQAFAQLQELKARRVEWHNPNVIDQGPEYAALLRDIAEAEQMVNDLEMLR